MKKAKRTDITTEKYFNTLNTELNPICHLLPLLGAHHILQVSGLRVNADESKRKFKSSSKTILIFFLPP